LIGQVGMNGMPVVNAMNGSAWLACLEMPVVDLGV
jgi:hypothetical protein